MRIPHMKACFPNPCGQGCQLLAGTVASWQAAFVRSLGQSLISLAFLCSSNVLLYERMACKSVAM